MKGTYGVLERDGDPKMVWHHMDGLCGGFPSAVSALEKKIEQVGSDSDCNTCTEMADWL